MCAGLSCEVTHFGATRAHRCCRQRALGVFTETLLCSPRQGLPAAAQGHMSNLSPPCDTEVCLTGGLWTVLSLVGASPIPSQQLGVPARPCRLSRMPGASPSLLPRVTSDQWHLRCSPGTLGCEAGLGRGHCMQSGSCKLKPAQDKLKTKGLRSAGQEHLGFALLLLQQPQHVVSAVCGCCWHHPECPTGSSTSTAGQDGPAGGTQSSAPTCLPSPTGRCTEHLCQKHGRHYAAMAWDHPLSLTALIQASTSF